MHTLFYIQHVALIHTLTTRSVTWHLVDASCTPVWHVPDALCKYVCYCCLQELWDDLAPQFQQAVGSFRLTETTSAYIAPDKDPWLFF